MDRSEDFVEEKTPTRRTKVKLNFADDGCDDQYERGCNDNEVGDFELTECTPDEGLGMKT